mmetsp:Transcript_40881/g.92113  ORF Transcript_40881/g.92113 Transcript_40881/m.92113 type:complete len:104 (+) Transcript_40881:380-691(+)
MSKSQKLDAASRDIQVLECHRKGAPNSTTPNRRRRKLIYGKSTRSPDWIHHRVVNVVCDVRHAKVTGRGFPRYPCAGALRPRSSPPWGTATRSPTQLGLITKS